MEHNCSIVNREEGIDPVELGEYKKVRNDVCVCVCVCVWGGGGGGGGGACMRASVAVLLLRPIMMTSWASPEPQRLRRTC